jgi:streptomycin 6-kinase
MRSPSLEAFILELHGWAGRVWLEERLPVILTDCRRKWSLNLGTPFPNLSYSFVVPAIRDDGLELVLKVGFLKDGQPDKELVTEHDALRHFDGIGMVRLIDADLSLGVLLLERLKPGRTIRSLKDEDKAASIAAELMKDLWKPVPLNHQFPSIKDWYKGFQRLSLFFEDGYGPFPKKLVDKAKLIFQEQITDSDSPVVLHGDLHHDNILNASRRPWLGIDPKGVIGEPAYEPGAFIRNIFLKDNESIEQANLARAIDVFSEHLNMGKKRITRWAFAQAVLSGWWHVEDKTPGWERTITLAKHLEQLM